MRRLAFLHQKGGTGKTTLAIGAAMALAISSSPHQWMPEMALAWAGVWATRPGARPRRHRP
jgi:hypothetical protein